MQQPLCIIKMAATYTAFYTSYFLKVSYKRCHCSSRNVRTLRTRNTGQMCEYQERILTQFPRVGKFTKVCTPFQQLSKHIGLDGGARGNCVSIRKTDGARTGQVLTTRGSCVSIRNEYLHSCPVWDAHKSIYVAK